MSEKILIFDYKDAEKDFFRHNKFNEYDLNFFEESLNEITVKNLPEDLLKKAKVISVFITSQITKKVLSKFKNLKIIATRSTGFDHIDIENCDKKGIKVLNVSNYGKNAVAQFTFGLIINAVRKISTSQADVQDFKFEYHNYIGRDLNRLTLGVIGTGAIGSEICHIANAFKMNILAYDFVENNDLKSLYSVTYTTKDELIANSDIITLHLPINKLTKNLITKKDFIRMKTSAIIVNTSRGELINTEDLYDAISSDTIAGAALDVIECEPIMFTTKNIIEKLKVSDSKCAAKLVLIRRLTQLPNVIITPHVAYSTQDAINYILKFTFDSIKDCIQGGHANQVN